MQSSHIPGYSCFLWFDSGPWTFLCTVCSLCQPMLSPEGGALPPSISPKSLPFKPIPLLLLVANFRKGYFLFPAKDKRTSPFCTIHPLFWSSTRCLGSRDRRCALPLPFTSTPAYVLLPCVQNDFASSPMVERNESFPAMSFYLNSSYSLHCKLQQLGLSNTLGKWIADFFTLSEKARRYNATFSMSLSSTLGPHRVRAN